MPACRRLLKDIIIIIIIIGVARFLLAVHPTLLLPVMLTSDDLFPVAILFTLSL